MADVQRSFDVIFLLFALVVPLVTGLFFLIITLQKARALTLLRAIGAPAGVLVRVAAGAGADHHRRGRRRGHAAVRAPVAGDRRLAVVALRPRAVVLWGALLLILGLVSAVAAARRVLAIDPVEATTGGGAR